MPCPALRRGARPGRTYPKWCWLSRRGAWFLCTVPRSPTRVRSGKGRRSRPRSLDLRRRFGSYCWGRVFAPFRPAGLRSGDRLCSSGFPPLLGRIASAGPPGLDAPSLLGPVLADPSGPAQFLALVTGLRSGWRRLVYRSNRCVVALVMHPSVVVRTFMHLSVVARTPA